MSTIYVDDLTGCLYTNKWRHSKACHLMIEPCTDINELHKFAKKMGLKRCWFQNKKAGVPHYDLTESKRVIAVRMGAVEIDRNFNVFHIIKPWRLKKQSKCND